MNNLELDALIDTDEETAQLEAERADPHNPASPYYEGSRVVHEPDATTESLKKSIIDKCPAVLGELTNYITETAIYPHPALSLASGIATLGLVMGKSHAGFRDIRTNVYCVGLAPSGSGKDHPLKMGKKLLGWADMSKHINGQPTSGSSFPSMLQKSDGKAMVFMDEIGRVLRVINSEKAGGFEKAISKELMELYSSAADTYYGKSYANLKENEPIVIEEPHLCLYGTTVKENLVDALVGRDALDGFLGRLLIFESAEVPDGDIKTIFQRDTAKKPEKLVSDLKMLSRPNKTIYGDVPHQCEYTQAAQDAYTDYWQLIDEIKAAQPHYASLYARCTEHMAKLSMMAAAGNFLKGQYIIDESHIAWGVSVANYNISLLVGLADQEIADDSRQKVAKRILRIVETEKVIKHSVLLNALRNVNADNLKNALRDLLEGDKIVKDKNYAGATLYKAFK
ncbi:hypothetical protein N9K75_02580 [bacterium]|nr:hypothetical protein [bacterium]